MYDKWMYVLKNLSDLMQRPATLQERVFTRLFEQAEIAKFNAEELHSYEESINALRDIVNAIQTAEKKKYAEGRAKGIAEGRAKGIAEGRAKGIAEGVRNTAKRLLTMGLPPEQVAQGTGLSVE